MLKILFLSANPSDLTRLNLRDEYARIYQVVGSSRYREMLDLRHFPDIPPSELVSVLIRERPDVIHFSGHGSPENELILVGSDARSHALTTEALDSIFGHLGRVVRLVVLNACYSEGQASALTKHVDFAIGMGTEIGDEAALEFSKGLYTALGDGQSMRNAFGLAIAQLQVVGIREDDTPKLLCRREASLDSALTRPVGEPREQEAGKALGAEVNIDIDVGEILDAITRGREVPGAVTSVSGVAAWCRTGPNPEVKGLLGRIVAEAGSGGENSVNFYVAGAEELVAAQYGGRASIDLPPGHYEVEAGRRISVHVQSAAQTSIDLGTLKVGVQSDTCFCLHLPGAKEGLLSSCGETTWCLIPGDYEIELHGVRMPFTVAPGETIEM